MSNDGSIGCNGQFGIKDDENCDEVFVRVEAAGLGPWTSEAIPFVKGSHQLSVRLQPANSLSGIIWSPDGKPAADAQLTLLTESQGMQFTSGYRPMGGKQTISSDL